MKTFHKYLLLQIPGWIIWSLILIWAHNALMLPLWTGGVLLCLAVVKDFVLYPFVRSAYESDAKTGAERLVGVGGKVQRAINPRGYVRVNGELWRAETELIDQPLPSGSPVTVRSFRGLTLIVVPEENLS
jgi:membrane protein implicated in regulation of membrane protease activity